MNEREDFMISSEQNFNRYTEWQARGTDESSLYKPYHMSKMSPTTSVVMVILFCSVIFSGVIVLASPVILLVYLYRKYRQKKEMKRYEYLSKNL